MLSFKRKKFSNGKGNYLSKGTGNQMHRARIGATASDFCTWKKDLGTIVEHKPNIRRLLQKRLMKFEA